MDDTRDLLQRIDARPSPDFVAALERRLIDGATTDAAPRRVDPSEVDLPTLDVVALDRHGARGRPSGRRILIVAAALVLFAAGVVVGRLGRAENQGTPASPTITGLTATRPIVTQVGDYLASDGRIVLHYEHGSNLATQVARDGTTSIVRLPAAMTPSWIRVVGGNWYVATADGVTIGTDDGTGELQWTPPAAFVEGTEVMSLAAHGNDVWLFRMDPVRGGRLERWNADLTRLEVSDDVDTIVGAMVATDDRLFATTDEGELWIIDRSGAQIDTVAGVGWGNRMVLVPDGDLWLADVTRGRLVAVTTDGEVRTRLALDSSPGGLAVVGSDLLVTVPYTDTLLVVDTRTASISSTTDTLDEPLDVAVADDSVWLSSQHQLQRLTSAPSP